MKLLKLFTLIITLNVYSQNQLKSLIDIKQIPKSMPAAKSFISEISSNYLIYDLIVGGNNTSQSNYQFKIKSQNDLKVNLPGFEGVFVTFYDPKTKLALKSQTIYVDYQLDYLRYYDELDIDKNNFSPFSYYDLATKLREFPDPEIVGIHKNLLTQIPSNDRFRHMLKEIGKRYKFTHPKTLEEIFNNQEQGLTLYNRAELFRTYLSKELNKNHLEVLYEIFIKEKDDNKTFENIKKVYDPYILERIDDIFLQKITINLNGGGKLNGLEKYLDITNGLNYNIDRINCILNIKDSTLIIGFQTLKAIEIEMKSAIIEGGKKILSKKVLSDQISLVITKSGRYLSVQGKYDKTFYKIEIE